MLFKIYSKLVYSGNWNTKYQSTREIISSEVLKYFGSTPGYFYFKIKQDIEGDKTNKGSKG